MKKIFTDALDFLKNSDIEQEMKHALVDAFTKVLESEELTARTCEIYKEIFDRKDVLQAEVIDMGDNEPVKELFTVAIYARAVYLTTEKKYEIPDERFDAVYQALRFIKQNKTRRGTWFLNDSSLFWAYSYTFPRMFQLGRLVFEMRPFDQGYEVYETEEGIVHLKKDTISVEGDTVYGCNLTADGLDVMDKKAYKGAKCIIKTGDMTLGIHLPGNDKLADEAVQASFDCWEKFHKKYFPDRKFKAFICSSWLLDTGLAQFVSETSNILKFQKRFTIPLRTENYFAIFDSIFNVPTRGSYDELVPTNRFQTVVLEHVKSGGKMYSGQGYILIK